MLFGYIEMSNFKCEKCGANITEKEDGTYGTFCEHYPKEIAQKSEKNKFLNVALSLFSAINLRNFN